MRSSVVAVLLHCTAAALRCHCYHSRGESRQGKDWKAASCDKFQPPRSDDAHHAVIRCLMMIHQSHCSPAAMHGTGFCMHPKQPTARLLLMHRHGLPGAYLRSKGLLHGGIWKQLRQQAQQGSGCRLLAFLELVATGLSYKFMPSNHFSAYDIHFFECVPGEEMCAPCCSHLQIMEKSTKVTSRAQS